MFKNKIIHTALIASLVLGTLSCKDQLQVGNPNAPTAGANVTDEAGIVSLTQGGTYYNGFNLGDGWLGNSYYSLPIGYNELIADNVGASASNNQVTTVGQPDYIILDNGTKQINTSPSIGILRTYNTRASTGAGNNAIYYQWLNMYSLNNSMNLILTLVDGIKFTGDAASKKATIKAWAYWWKGFAYSSIGSKYYYGLIVDDYGKTNNNYLTHDLITANSDKYFNLAITTLQGITSATDYTEVMTALIPAHFQVGKGTVPTQADFIANINTMLARNIIQNKLAPFVNNNPAAVIAKSSTTVMTAADWASIKTLAGAGITASTPIFTGRTAGTNDFFTATGGSVSALASTPNNQSTFKVSERAIAAFKFNDKRLANNFNTSSTYSNDYIYTTRYNVVSGGNAVGGAIVYANRTVGAYELTMAGTYEENLLMLAEANIRTGAIETGLGQIDAVRAYQGAGVTNVAGTSLTLAGALKELTMERRAALLFKGLYFYDMRRWGWTYDIANGGGSYGNTVVQGATVNTNATIDYNFLDYWDVPANESELNPTADKKTVIKNPNF